MQRISPISVPTDAPRSTLKFSLSATSTSRFSRSFWTALLATAALHSVTLAAPVSASKTAKPASSPASAGKGAAARSTPARATTARASAPQSQIAGLNQSQVKVSSVVTRVEWQAPAVEAPTMEAPATEAKSVTRLAAAAPGAIDTDQPPAAPVENPPALTVPVAPDEGEQPTPAPAPENPGETQPATPPVTLTPAPGTPPVTGETNIISPNDAEGREIAAVRVVGNRVISEDTILLAIAATKPGAAFSSRQADLDRRRVRELGYFAAVDYQVVPNLQDPNKVDVIFVLIENRVVTGFRFEGNRQVPAEDLQKVLLSQSGAVLSSKNVDEDVKRIQEAFRQRGYAALVTDVHQEADGTVVYVVQEGTISRVDIEGLNKTRPSIVRSVILTEPGDPFNEQDIQKDLNRIYDLGFFEDVSYRVSDDPEKPGALIVTITVKERRTGQISFGVGFDSRSKISGFAGVSESNFRGTGKNVSAQVELGSQRSFNFGFGDRFVGSNNASYSFNIYDQTRFREPRSVERFLGGGTGNDEERFDYEERRQGLRFNYTHPLDFERTRNVLLGYRLEKVRLFLRDDDNSVPIDLPTDSDGRVGAVSIGFLRDRRDLKLDPSRGGRELLTLEQGASFFGGTSNFTKIDLDVRRYIPLIGAPERTPGQPAPLPRLVLAGRFVVGQSLGQLPAFEQYFIGGSETVRGYDADEQYGDNQIFGNVELRFRLQRKIQLVAFADAGSAYGGEFSSSSGFSALFGVGVGARLQTPIGPVRLDIARGDDGIKTHFGIGSTF